jgi:hypothetical protein
MDHTIILYKLIARKTIITRKLIDHTINTRELIASTKNPLMI